jgi:hypothetical protein
MGFDFCAYPSLIPAVRDVDHPQRADVNALPGAS